MSDWWRGSVTYQVYPRSFQDTDGDGIGDIPGITRRLEHIAGLGVDAVWLSPVFTSPMADMGYDVSDYTGIDPLFGTLADFDALLDRAHELGLKVIVDQVISHSSDRHPWFQESLRDRTNPKANWYVWADANPDGSPPNNWVSVFGGSAWEWDATRRQYYLHNFLTSQPDLNFHEPEVQDALLDVMRFWLDRGVDGFRLDTVNYYFHDTGLRSNPPAKPDDDWPPVNTYEMQEHLYSKTRPENIGFLKRIRALVDEYDGRTLVGEVGDTRERSMGIMGDYTSGGDKLHMAYSFDMLGPDYSAGHFRSLVTRFFNRASDGWPCWSFSNHDVVRHATRWAENADTHDGLVKQALALLLSLRGSVCLYQGEELGLTETALEFEELTDPPGIRFWPDYKGRDGCRTPIPWEADKPHGGFSEVKPWLPVKPPQLARSVDSVEADPNGSLAFYREMMRFRKSRPELITGDIRFLETEEPVLAFIRSTDATRTAVVLNLSPLEIDLEIEGLNLMPNAPVQAAKTGEGSLILGPNGFGYFDAQEDAAIRSA
ncbi:alpha-glucosidase family protein [Amaricoccus tamworthensis]|uniref:alpha-glucosidase family protein n=1 Tax=Amaricoccus tamworthensis TaxID=57002 RepID=UPI003C7DB089